MGSGGSVVAAPERGQVVLVPFPFTDLSGTKQRPALVISPRGFHPDDLILCAITSQVPTRLARCEVPLLAGDVIGARLPKPSIIRAGKLFTLHQGLVRGRFGRVSEAKLDDVLSRLRDLFSADAPAGTTTD